MIRERATLIVCAIFAVISALALGHVWVHLQVIEAGYELARQTRLRHDLAEQNQKLRLELGTRKDPAVIERKAREELHMAPPDPGAIRSITLDRGARLDGAGAAKAPHGGA